MVLTHFIPKFERLGVAHMQRLDSGIVMSGCSMHAINLRQATSPGGSATHYPMVACPDWTDAGISTQYILCRSTIDEDMWGSRSCFGSQLSGY